MTTARVEFSNGVYEGGVDGDGAPSGIGRLVYTDGSSYEGQWFSGWLLVTLLLLRIVLTRLAGRITGEGVFNYSNGDVYEGM